MATQPKRKTAKAKTATPAVTPKVKKLKLTAMPKLKQPKLKQLKPIADLKKTKPRRPRGRRHPHPEPPPTSADGAPADPEIISPLANAMVPAGLNLFVDLTTDRGDLGYILEVLDTTPLPAGVLPPPAVQFIVPAPGANNFSVNVPGAMLVGGHTYRLRVFVNPANGLTPPHLDFVINITAQAVVIGPIPITPM